MKKTLSLLLAALMILSAVFAFAACKKDGGDTTTAAPADDTTAAPADDATEAPAADGDLAYILGKGTLIVGITDYAPMDYKEDGSDEWVGFDADYARAFAKEIGVEVEFIEIDWDNKANELQSKSIDCIWNGMTILEKLKTSMDITDAYAMNAQVVVMKADKAADYADVEAMKELTFAVEAGSAGAETAGENGFTVTEVNTQADALTEVESGAADACIIDLTMANAMTGEGTSYADLAKVLSLNEEEYGVGVRLGSDLCAKINEVTAKLVEDGTMAGLAEKYQITLAG